MPRTLLLLAVAASVSSSCVANRAYRNGAESALFEQLRTGEFDRAEAVDDAAARLSWPYRLAFIEFDDRGEMFDRDQLNRALQAIDATKADARALGVRPVAALFVHGWKNNASDSSGNVWGFRQLLAGLSLQFGKPEQAEPKAPVVGIYVGWRGAVVSAPIVEEFTFWDRRQKSQNLPSAHMVEALLKVMQQAKGVDYDDANTISVLIGHSFGGAVLETALTQTLEGMVLKAGRREPLKSPANLMMFLNEAQEATRSYQLIESMIANLAPQDHCQPKLVDGKRRFENPMIVSISSTGDEATRAFFPFGQLVLRPFNSLRTYSAPNPLGITSQRPMFFNTTAHMKEFQSHLIDIVGAQEETAQTHDVEFTRALASCTRYLDVSLHDLHYQIIEKPGSKNHTPYWVMEMPPSIVPDHSTIFTPVFRKFLISLLENTL